jgi:glutathione S-transferase
LMLNLCGADWEARYVDYFNGETRTPEFREINAMGEVPVLEHQGRRWSQSGVILDFLAARFGRFGWQDEDQRREILRWLLWDNHKLTSYIGTLRFLLRFQKTGESQVTEFLRSRVNTNLALLERQLAGRAFVTGERASIADLSICGYLYWPDEFGVAWADYPNIEAWLARIAALPGWVHPYQLMPGHPRPAKS